MRIDCSLAVNYMPEFDRMCGSHRSCREGCPSFIPCHSLGYDYKGLVAATQLWSDENPLKLTMEEATTRLSNVDMVKHGDIREALLLILEEVKDLKENKKSRRKYEN